MATFFCELCQRPTDFQSIQQTIGKVSVSKSTLYSWMNRSLVHWRTLPNKRRLICVESLSRQGINKIVSETVQNRSEVKDRYT
jgi:predicted DNA-binding transcriptional regulator AlpA